jgi:hypothetical protein
VDSGTSVMLGLVVAGIAVALVKLERMACKSEDLARRVNQIAKFVGVDGYFEDEDEDDDDEGDDDADVYTGPYCDSYRCN